MTTSTLTSALAVYSLSLDDLPGIEAAWEARFAALADPLPDTPEAVLGRLRPVVYEWLRFTIDEITPRSDGGLDVTIDGERYISDDGEDDTDDVELVSEFTLTADEAKELLIARENRALRASLDRLRSDTGRIAAGTSPIWWLLAADSSVNSRFNDAARILRSAENRLGSVKKYLEQLEMLQSALDTSTPLTREEENSFLYATGFARGLRLYGTTGASLRDKDVVRADEVSRVAAKLAEYEPQYTRLQTAMSEAQALPEGPLREFLLGVRESRTYNTTVGTGRSKKIVQNTYTPTSDLVSNHKNAVEGYTSATNARDALLERIAAFREHASTEHAAATAALAAAEADLAAVWAEGWPGTQAAPAPLDRPSEW